jgi:hypothetical protein
MSRRIVLNKDANIVWIGRVNPGSPTRGDRYKRIDKLIRFSGKQVGTYLAAGGNPQTLRNCIRKGHCKQVERIA